MSDAFIDLLLPVSEPKPDEVVGETALRLLQAVYRNKRAPLSLRMRAAALAIPYETPKLAVTARVTEGDFAEALDRAVQRSDAVRVLELAANSDEPDR